MSNVEIYLESLYIQEDLSKYIKSLLPESTIKSFFSKAEKNIDEKKPLISLKKISKILPKVKHEKVISLNNFFEKRVPEFKDNRIVAEKVLKNSIANVNDKVLFGASIILSLTSLIKRKDDKPDIKSKEILKRNLKEFVGKVNKFIEVNTIGNEENKSGVSSHDYADLAVAWVLVTTTLAIVSGVGLGVYLLFVFIKSNMWWMIILAAFILALAAVVSA